MMMKKIWIYALGAFAVILMTTGCIQDRCTSLMTWYEFTPIYKSVEEVRQMVGTEGPRSLENPGKIYVYQNYLLINEINKGFHVIDNSDPSSPNPIAFIVVPGSHDMAVRGGVLYSDSFMDLVAIGLADPTNASELSRDEDVFAYGSWHPNLWAEQDSGIAVDWIRTEIKEEGECNGGGGFVRRNTFTFTSQEVALDATGGGGGEVPSGTGGSMARFTLWNNYLYVVTNSDLLSFSVETAADPIQTNQTQIGWEVETIYPFEGHLFVGARSGMYIYSVENTPETPQFVSELTRFFFPCDPVVATRINGKRYVFETLRDGSNCGGPPVNQLWVIDATDLSNPQLIHTYEMKNPHGLGVKDETLFLCEGEWGLKVFDLVDLAEIDKNKLAHFKDMNAFDIIPLNDIGILIGDDGLYQYDISDPTDIEELSHIPVLSE